MNKGQPTKTGRDLITERFVDALILSRGYFDAEGRLLAERLVGDALLIRGLIYGDAPFANADRAAADDPQKGPKHRAIHAEGEFEEN
jgi:hypothetical protein